MEDPVDDPASWRFLTARLLIRPAEPGDARAIFEARAASPYVSHRDLNAVRRMIDEQGARSSIDAPGWHGFAMVHLGDDAVVGDVNIEFAQPLPEQARIGYSTHPDWRRRGFAYEGVGRMLNHLLGDYGLHRVEALTDRRNAASRRLLEKLRFRLEGRYVQSFKLDGQWVDERGYARLAGE